MSDRKLASIQRVVKVEPIKDADRIVKVTVLGWELVCKKNEVKEGDLGVYIEIDSILPPTDEFKFLEDRKYRVKTIKLKGQVSQGLFLPLDILPKDISKKVGVGDDVTSILGVTKYLSPSELDELNTDVETKTILTKVDKYLMQYKIYRIVSKYFRGDKKKGTFPSFISKTDEDRIQLFPNICEKYKGIKFQSTEKIDGQSFTGFVKVVGKTMFFTNKYDFGVCSRNLRLLHPNNSSWWYVAKHYNIKNILIKYCKENNLQGAYIQGEILGPKIQGNKYKFNDYKLYVFNVGHIEPKKLLDNIKIGEFCEKNNLLQVPVLDNNSILKDTIPACVESAKGKSVIYDTIREGIVLRNYDLGISFKIINPDFLLGNDN